MRAEGSIDKWHSIGSFRSKRVAEDAHKADMGSWRFAETPGCCTRTAGRARTFPSTARTATAGRSSTLTAAMP